MWQNVIVIVIVLIAAYFVLRNLVRMVSGRRGCEIDACANCPFEEGCEDPDKRRPRRKKSGGGCGCGCE